MLVPHGYSKGCGDGVVGEGEARRVPGDGALGSVILSKGVWALF